MLLATGAGGGLLGLCPALEGLCVRCRGLGTPPHPVAAPLLTALLSGQEAHAVREPDRLQDI